MTDLLPCPFCGGDVHLADTGVHWVVCNVCSAEGPPADTEADAIAKWSVRSRLGVRPTQSDDVAQGCVNSRLAEFFKWAMREGPWEGGDLDGGSVQDKAESLGLIVKTKYDPAVHGPAADWMFEAGDDYYTFAPDLAAQPPAAPAAQPTRDKIYEIVLRELETRHPVPTTVLLATRIANALAAQPSAAPAAQSTRHSETLQDILARFHRNSCYPEASDYEMGAAVTQILAVILASQPPAAPAPDQAWRDSNWLSLSASEKACYHWPDDTDLHRQCRAAYIAGATDYAQPPTAPVTDGSIREGDVLSYTMTDGVGKVTAHVRPPAAQVEEFDIDSVPSCGQENDYRRAKPVTPVTDADLPTAQDVRGILLPDWKQDQADTSVMPRKAAPVETDELTAGCVKLLPGGTLDDSTFSQIEDALDAIEAPMVDHDGRYMTLVERIKELPVYRSSAGNVDAGAKRLAAWINYAWEGIKDGRIADRGDYPQWSYNGIGALHYQGGREDLRDLAREIAHLVNEPQQSAATAHELADHLVAAAGVRSDSDAHLMSCAAELLRTFTEPQESCKWRPIETAPRESDAMFMVCAVGDARGPFVVRSDILWRAREAGTPSHLGLSYLTHWMPLPEMPQ